MRIGFLMDPLESIDPVYETTSHLMYECNERGHSVFFLEPHDLYVRRGVVVARMRDVTVPPGLSMRRYWRGCIGRVRKGEMIHEPVAGLDALFLRKNPPLHYQTMELLEPLSREVFMVNSVRGQIVGNSKLYILNFPDLIPETHVSRDPSRLRKVIDEFGGSMVVKPLQRYGGEGVIKVSAQDPENLNSLIHYYVKVREPYPQREPIMVQEYLDAVRTEGDVRVLMLNGEILGAMRRMPHGADFRTNIAAGGRVVRHEVTPEERLVCEAIRERLVRDGLHFVGVDIIGGKLVEVNCVSPGGIPRINRLNRARLEVAVIDFVEAEAAKIKQARLSPPA